MIIKIHFSNNLCIELQGDYTKEDLEEFYEEIQTNEFIMIGRDLINTKNIWYIKVEEE